jgi:gamma-glutamyltranspeptidase/glutathione hydrolase
MVWARIGRAVLVAHLACAGWAWSQQPDNGAVPEGASPLTQPQSATWSRRGVVSAHANASQAGLRVLQQGGNAVDAAIAMQWVLSVVEPQSSGLGGGGFAVVWAQGKAWAFDGRETAPAATTPDLFVDQGSPMGFERARADARSVGVPGQVPLLLALHRQLGRLPWSTLMQPAIRAAEQGFEVGPRLHALLQNDPLLRADPEARKLYYRVDGHAVPTGTRLRNPELGWVQRQ